MFIGASSEGPMELSLILNDREFIDACVSRMHQPFRVEFQFHCRRRETNYPSIVILVGKPDGNPVVQKSQISLIAGSRVLGSTSREQRDDLLTPVGELARFRQRESRVYARETFPGLGCSSRLLPIELLNSVSRVKEVKGRGTTRYPFRKCSIVFGVRTTVPVLCRQPSIATWMPLRDQLLPN